MFWKLFVRNMTCSKWKTKIILIFFEWKMVNMEFENQRFLEIGLELFHFLKFDISMWWKKWKPMHHHNFVSLLSPTSTWRSPTIFLLIVNIHFSFKYGTWGWLLKPFVNLHIFCFMLCFFSFFIFLSSSWIRKFKLVMLQFFFFPHVRKFKFCYAMYVIIGLHFMFTAINCIQIAILSYLQPYTFVPFPCYNY